MTRAEVFDAIRNGVLFLIVVVLFIAWTSVQ